MNDPDQIPADRLEQALGAARETELKAVMEKALGGQPLTARERKLLEDAAPPAKNAALPAFALRGEGAAEARFARMTQPGFAKLYGYSLRAVKNWVEDGKKKGDPVPLSRPEDMPAWFERVYDPRKCPDRLWRAVQDIQSGPSSPEAAAAPPATVVVERFEIEESEKGVLATLQRLREAEATVHKRYLNAIANGNPKEGNFLSSEWRKTVEQIRAFEKSAPEILAAAGIYLRKDELRRELVSINKAIIRTLRQQLRNNRARLRSTESTEDWNQAVDEIVDQACEELVASQFAEPLTLEAA